MDKPPIFNIAHRLDRAARLVPDRTSLTYASQRWTVAEAAADSRRYAQLLVQAGVGRGDRVMIVAHNSPHHLLLLLACARLGAILVPASYRYTQFELQALVNFLSPRVVVAEPEVASRGGFDSSGGLFHLVIDDDVQAPPYTAALAYGYVALTAAKNMYDGALISDGAAGPAGLNQQAYPEGAALMILRSYFPNPRAVPLTHANLWWADRNFREILHYDERDTVLAASPMSNIGGLSAGLIGVFTGGGHVVVARDAHPNTLATAIEREHISVMFAVPTVYSLLLAGVDVPHRDFSSLRLAVCGGSAPTGAFLDATAAAGIHPVSVWGTAEACGVGCVRALPAAAEPGNSIGAPMAYIELRIQNPETGEPAESGESGVLEVRGPSVATGYWLEDDLPIDAEGWVRTGDFGRLDEDGVVLTGRLGDTILTGGETVHPEEVEEIVRQFPGVEDVVVVGRPDPLWGEHIVAVVSLRVEGELSPGAEIGGQETEFGLSGHVAPQPALPAPTLDELQSFVGQVLARYKVPREMVEVESIPRTPAGAPDRERVRAELLARVARGTSQDLNERDQRPSEAEVSES